MKQDPKALFEAFAASAARPGNRIPAWERVGPEVQAHWTAVALAAGGLVVERLDPGLEQIAREIERGSTAGAHFDPEHASAYWTARTWARMAGSYPAGLGAMRLHTGEAPAGAFVSACVELAKLGGFDLLGVIALADRGRADLPIAVVDVIRSCGAIASNASRLQSSARLMAPDARSLVAATFRRIAHCYDELMIDGKPLAVGPALRCCATWIENSNTRSAA